MDDEICGRDSDGTDWEASKWDGSDAARVEIGGSTAVWLSRPEAMRLGLFLLSAAGVDIVDAARRVVEAREALGRSRPGSVQVVDALAAMMGHAQELQAELAKLDEASPCG